MTVSVRTGARSEAFERALDELVSASFASRLFERDATLWGAEAEAEAQIRLGWANAGEDLPGLIEEVESLRLEFAERGVDRFVLCGMGGSSLAPLVITGTSASTPSGLVVLDSTHPDSVREIVSHDIARTAVIVSSKSGTTLETTSQRLSFVEAFTAAGIEASERIVVVTDPGSALETQAREHGERVFLADPDVGGRFSALTAFGVVPSVLAGADMPSIVRDALALRDALQQDSADNPALRLAAAIAAGLPDRFALELHGEDEAASLLGLWIEQLIAESTGKQGKGVLPIAMPFGSDGAARLFPGSTAATAVRIGLGGALAGAEALPGADAEEELAVSGSLGEQFLLWETATAALGRLIGVDPFDQPDVESAKEAARQQLATASETQESAAAPLSPADRAADCAAQLRASATARRYLAIQAFVPVADSGLDALLEELRATLIETFSIPVSLGYGPRYLHSTGQFHKGGPAVGVFLQIVGLVAAEQDLGIPGGEMSFGGLLAAQAAGDAAVLRERGNPVIEALVEDASGFVRELIQRLSA